MTKGLPSAQHNNNKKTSVNFYFFKICFPHECYCCMCWICLYWTLLVCSVISVSFSFIIKTMSPSLIARKKTHHSAQVSKLSQPNFTQTKLQPGRSNKLRNISYQGITGTQIFYLHKWLSSAKLKYNNWDTASRYFKLYFGTVVQCTNSSLDNRKQYLIRGAQDCTRQKLEGKCAAVKLT